MAVFKLSKSSIIYVLCPANLKTGGTELLHQLVKKLNDNNHQAYITYFFEGRQGDSIPFEFKKYVKEYRKEKDIVDSTNNLIIFPEVCIGKHRKYKKIQKAVWWLSVDNYFFTRGKLNRLHRYGVKSFLKHLYLRDYAHDKDIREIPVHLYQSYFAANFLKEIGVPSNKTFYLSDYVNDSYLNIYSDDLIENKENNVIYNPKKGLEFTKKIIAHCSVPIKWIPIENMSNEEVIRLMKKSKVYIDFGNHPGKDRMPREAAMCGCCIITDLRGSAEFSEDVPIPNSYKFKDEDKNLDLIMNKIEQCLINYKSSISDFSDYRKYIQNEKQVFSRDVKRIFD